MSDEFDRPDQSRSQDISEQPASSDVHSQSKQREGSVPRTRQPLPLSQAQTADESEDTLIRVQAVSTVSAKAERHEQSGEAENLEDTIVNLKSVLASRKLGTSSSGRLRPGGKYLTSRGEQFRLRVLYYREWLARQASYDAQRDRQKELHDYIEEATRPVNVHGISVRTFAPFRARLSALQTFTRGQLLLITLLALLWLAGLYIFQLRMVTALVIVISALYLFHLLVNASLVLRYFRADSQEDIDERVLHALKHADWPVYTILCPLYRETEIVPQFVQAMEDMDYPKEKLQILLLTEENDIETREVLRSLNLPAHFRVLTVPDGQPRTKPRACNYGLLSAEGTYVVIYDAEDIPDPLQLKKAILTFANHNVNVACVQARLNCYNVRQNPLTRWFTAEYSTWFDLILPSLQQAGFVLPLGGSSNHFRVDVLRALGAWDAYNVTEDCDLGLRLRRYKFDTVVLNSTTMEEANPQLKNWLRQRSRWIKGYMQSYLVYMRNPLEYLKKGQFGDLLSFQMIVGAGAGLMLVNPLMWILLLVYAFLGPQVNQAYSVLFPGPVLYLSAFCLIFGNFFYLYLYMLACMKRRLYHVLPWILLMPIYWVLMSCAAFFAFYELLVRPHYWQKTVHGLHLKGAWSFSRAQTVEDIPSPEVPVSSALNSTGNVSSISMSLRAMATQILPAIPRSQQQVQQTARRTRVRDLWLLGTVVLAVLLSIGACVYFYRQNDILLYNAAYAHMRLARSVFDSATPGLSQLGGVWLPLPQILMLPFIWNDFLWHSGLAGSLVSMFSYVLASAFLFLSIRRLTGRSLISFLGTLSFMLNPNILYLQSSPLSELICIALFALTGFAFICWMQDGWVRYLTLTAVATFLLTLARYDGWAVFLALLILVPVVSLVKRQRGTQVLANLLFFLVPGCLGIVLWLIWNQIIFHDPFFFQHGVFSSEALQRELVSLGTLSTYHNVWISLQTYTLDALDSVGAGLFVLAVIGLVVILLRRRPVAEKLALLLFLVPFAFYVFSLYAGQAAIWVPGAAPASAAAPLYNARYGSQMVVPAALFLSLLVALLVEKLQPHWRIILRLGLLLVILGQICWTVLGSGIVALQDGQRGVSCAPVHPINIYLAQHYNGGKILMDASADDYNVSETGIAFQQIIYDGSGILWTMALANPEGSVDWIIVNRKPTVDLVGQSINVDNPAFLNQFTLVEQEGSSVYLYHRNDGTPLTPTHPVPAGLLSNHLACPSGS